MTFARYSPKEFCTLAAAALLLACAPHTEPQQLVDARAAFASASSGGAAELAPVELDNARIALAAAEDRYHHHPGSSSVVDLSYVAQRKSQEAAASAATRMAERQRAQQLAAQARADAQRAQQTREQLSATREQLAAEQARSRSAEQSLRAEQTARAAAEERADDALAQVREIADVRESVRGLVITLSGQVLFATGQSVLLPSAQQRLGLVATMLRDMSNRTIQIDGHTDAVGDTNTNYALSNARADAVRQYLVANGVAPDRIRATGFGPSRPVADNATPEGRAENRRVEIVLEPPTRAVGGGPD